MGPAVRAATLLPVGICLLHRQSWDICDCGRGHTDLVHHPLFRKVSQSHFPIEREPTGEDPWGNVTNRLEVPLILTPGTSTPCLLATGNTPRFSATPILLENIRTTPVAVIGLSEGVAAISAGARFTCALTTAGRVKC